MNIKLAFKINAKDQTLCNSRPGMLCHYRQLIFKIPHSNATHSFLSLHMKLNTTVDRKDNHKDHK